MPRSERNGVLGHLRRNLIAYLALFVALSGSAYAATALPKNSVGAKQIRKGAVTPAKLSPAALALAQRTAGPPGAQGVPGATGEQGAAGVPGASGVLGADAVWVEEVTLVTCGRTDLVDLPVQVTQPSRLFVSGQAVYMKTGKSPEVASLRAVLLEANEDEESVGSTMRTSSGARELEVNYAGDISTSGLLMTEPESSLADATVAVIPPGEYRLTLVGENSGVCTENPPRMRDISLDYLLLPAGP